MALTQRIRSLLSLVVMLALATGAGLYAYFGVFQKQEQEEAAREKKDRLFPDLDKAKVAQVTVVARGATTVLARSSAPEGGWTIVSPVNAPADKAAADAVVDKLASLKSKGVVEEKAQDLARFGLATPTLKVTARLQDGRELVLRAGEENSYDGSVYVATGDSADVLQVEGGFKWALEKDTFELREKRVLAFEEADVRALEVRLDGAAYSLRKDEGTWQLVSPLRDRADEQTVTRLLGSLKNLRASRFVSDTARPEELAARGLDQPRLEATVSLASGSSVSLAVSHRDDEGGIKKAWAKRRDATFIAEVPEAIFGDLTVKPFDLRDKSLLSFEKDKVARVSFVVGDEAFTVERLPAAADAGRPSEDWAFAAPSPGPTRKWKMNSVMWGLSSLKATGIAEENATDFARYGLDQPSRTVTLFDEAGRELGALLFGKESEGKVFARNKAESRVLEVDKARLGELPSKRADLEEPKPVPDAGASS